MRHPRPFTSRSPGEPNEENFGFADFRRVFPQLLSFAAPHKRLLIIGLLALLVASGINLFFPYYLRGILNSSSVTSLALQLPTIVLTLIALFALQAVMFYIRHRSFGSAGFLVVADLRRELFRALMRQDVAFYDASRVGDLMSRLSSDTAQVQNAVTVNISVALRYFLQVVGGICLMSYISLKLTTLILLLIPLLLIGSRWWGIRLATLSRAMQQQIGETAVVAEEALGSIRTVLMFAGTDYEETRYRRALDRALALGLKRTRFAALFSSTIVFLLHTMIAVVLWYGVGLLLSNELTPGDLTAFLLYCVIVAVSLGFLVSAFDDFFHAAGSGARILDLMAQQSRIRAEEPSQAVPSRSDLARGDKPHFEFQGVTFAYPSRPESPVIKCLDLAVSYGSTIAIAGASGAGKTSVTALLTRFYDPQSGRILFGGVDIKHCHPVDLRGQISIVAQDVTVFSTSIRENVLYGRVNASMAEIEAVCRAANLHDFITSLPDQYETLVGDRGVLLSGGQKQRLAIARALLKDPTLLILDEATSALDSENEHLVQDALRRLMLGRTTLIIAHRLSTVQHADRVIVLDHGTVVESGKHEELILQRGLYHSFVERQMLS